MTSERPTACPAGHPWTPGRIHSSWGRADGFTTYCYLRGDVHHDCPWYWTDPEVVGGQWRRRRMPGRWSPDDGGIRHSRDAEILVDGHWRPGRVDAWLPIPGDGWEVEAGVDMGAGWPDVKMRVRPDRVRR